MARYLDDYEFQGLLAMLAFNVDLAPNSEQPEIHFDAPGNGTDGVFDNRQWWTIKSHVANTGIKITIDCDDYFNKIKTRRGESTAE